MIKATGLNKYYNKGKPSEIHVINDTSLELPDNGIVTLMGESGSGKTTLLNVLGGLDKATGQIKYDDLEITNYRMQEVDKYRNKHIGYIFQNYNLLPEHTIYGNLDIALSLYGVSDKEERNRRIEYALTAVGMMRYRRKNVNALSGGQQQRVSIARALVKDCKIIMCDEPTGNLDSKNTIEIMKILKQISKTRLILLVTHDRDMSNYFSDYIIEIIDGKIGEVKENDLKGTLLSKQYTTYLKDLKEDNKTTEDFTNEIGQVKYVDKTLTKKEKFNKFFNNVKKSFALFRGGRKKEKILHYSFFMIGIVLAIIFLTMSSSKATSNGKYQIEKNVVTVFKKELNQTISNTDMYQILNTEGVKSISTSSKGANYAEKGMDLRIFDKKTIEIFANIMAYDTTPIKLITGKKPKIGEIVVSKYIADYCIRNYKGYGIKGYKDLIGKSMEIGNAKINYIISGVSKDNANGIYMCDLDFYTQEIPKTSILPTDIKVYTLSEYKELHPEVIISTDHEPQPSIVKTRFHVAVDTVTKAILARNNLNLAYIVNQSFDSDERVMIFIDDEELNFFKDYLKNIASGYIPIRSLDKDKISSGRMPENDSEVIANDKFYKIGDMVGRDYWGKQLVVGTYSGTHSENYVYMFTTRADYLGIISSTTSGLHQYIRENGFNIVCEDKEKVMSILSEDFTCVDYYIHLKDFGYINNIKLNQILILALIVLIIIVVITCILVNRSRMLKNIYTIGVYRALGASRLKINKMFLYSNFIITTFTTVLGFTLSIMFMKLIFANYEQFDIKATYIIGGYVGIYLINILSSMIPTMLLMRKTPAQILAKYDI